MCVRFAALRWGASLIRSRDRGLTHVSTFSQLRTPSAASTFFVLKLTDSTPDDLSSRSCDVPLASAVALLAASCIPKSRLRFGVRRPNPYQTRRAKNPGLLEVLPSTWLPPFARRWHVRAGRPCAAVPVWIL